MVLDGEGWFDKINRRSQSQSKLFPRLFDVFTTLDAKSVNWSTEM